MIYKPFNVKGNVYKVYYDGSVISPRGNTLKPMNNGNGYMYVCLGKREGNYKNFYVHILVCTLFHPNPNNLPEVNHIDGCRWNNHGDNLEWITRLDNIRDYKAKGRAKYPNRKKIKQYTLEGYLLCSYDSSREAALVVGCTKENIQMAATGISKTAKGYIWKYQLY